ncbi:MAG: dihydropteroate synthase [Blastochloris sp.]|nr:dihydropteroate synthase [Blastochloris sp.]
MGILNVTPDSFSDGGKYLHPDQALEQAAIMIHEGADIIDVGGESTRPGATAVTTEEELARTVPVIQALVKQHPNIPISIDTYKTMVADQAVHAGASIINDVGAALWGDGMLEVLQKNQVGYICMHTQGRPQDMQKNPTYSDVVADVLSFLSERKSALLSAGIAQERLAFDVGIGFGKTLEHNIELIRQAEKMRPLERPLLWGLSRKSFISKLLNTSAQDRLVGGLTAYAKLLSNPSPQIWRVHDVAAHAQLIRMWAAL